MGEYQPIPVDIARRIARDYAKGVVVIFAWDVLHDRTHCTTYAVHPGHKEFAAELGRKTLDALGVPKVAGESFEDFRARPEAEAAAEIAGLKNETERLADMLATWKSRYKDLRFNIHRDGGASVEMAHAKADRELAFWEKCDLDVETEQEPGEEDPS